jgi:hypothetical protein
MCQTNTGKTLLIAVHLDSRTALFFPPSCKKWNCPDCSKRKKAYYSLSSVKAASTYLDLGCAVFFCTITSHEKLYTPDHMRFVFRRAWPKLRKRAVREAGYFDYFGVAEAHR